MNLQVDFAGLTLEHPLMNAAGTCKLTEQVKQLARSTTAAIMVGSGTILSRPGNTGEVFWKEDAYESLHRIRVTNLFSLNSLGLPNPGVEYYRRELPEMVKIAHDAGKPLIMSVAGFTPAEYGILTEVAVEGGVDAVEENLGCPNVWDDDRQKRIACFDLRLMHEILFEEIARRVGHGEIIGVKPSPFSDPAYLMEFASLLKDGLVAFLTVSNTFPNAFALDLDGKPRITPGGGLAGLAGGAMKPINLGQIVQYKQVLGEGFPIVAAGGIQTAQDMLDFWRVGATAMQINTAYGEDDRVFERLLSEYIDLREDAEARVSS